MPIVVVAGGGVIVEQPMLMDGLRDGDGEGVARRARWCCCASRRCIGAVALAERACWQIRLSTQCIR